MDAHADHEGLLRHTIHAEPVAYGWDRERGPVRTVAPGDELEIELLDASDGQLHAQAAAEDVAGLDPGRANPLTGPIAVEGLEPGDGLEIELVDVASADWGWTALIPGFGLLADDFGDPRLRISRVADGRVDVDGLATLPHRPFLGTVGVAADQPGVLDVIPPRHVGGNLDLTDVRPGARLLLPVEVGGALVSLGDGHAAQGDGEVCGTAVETPTVATVRLRRVAGGAPAAPRLEIPAPPPPVPGPRVTTTGVGPDLMVGAREAVARMVEDLSGRGLDPADAYLLCSVAGDLRIGEVVDAPNWVVAFTFPLDVLS